MIRRLFTRQRPQTWETRPSPVAATRQDKPDLAGRRAFLASHIFLHTHIPKTGGSTLSTVMSSTLGFVHCMDLRHNRRVTLEEMTEEDRNALAFVSDHRAWGLHTYFTRTPLYLAVVRDPVERAVSMYRFLQGNPDHPDHSLVQGKSFEEAWAADGTTKGKAAGNVQARMLTGTAPRRDVAENELWRQIEDTYFLVIPQPRLTQALNRIRAAFGVPFYRIPPQNVSKGFETEVSTDMRTRILDANRTDLELYARVTEDFDQHLARACDYIASHCLLPLQDGDT